MTDLTSLADRVEAGTTTDNALDVLVEVALFKPDEFYRSVRANAAGTKVVYTDHDGKDHTHWAGDWTLTAAIRRSTAAALYAHAAAY